MMEDSLAEWGKVIVLDLPAQPIHRTLLLKLFTAARPPHRADGRPPQAAPVGSLALSLARQALPQSLRPLFPTLGKEALAVPYTHPHVIDAEITTEPSRPAHKPLVPTLLLTAVSSFAAWYIYRVTGQKLDLQTQVKSYAESLQQEKQVRSSLTGPQVKVLALEGMTAGGVTAKIFWNAETQACWVYLDHLPPLTPPQFFQLWFFSKDERFLRARQFAAANGAAELNIQLPPASRGNMEHILVSVESSEKYSFPEGKILVKGRLP